MGATVSVNTSNHLKIERDNSKLLIGGYSVKGQAYKNASASSEVIPEGTVMGRIASTSLLAKLDETKTDGSQYPVGVLASEIEVGAGLTMNVQLCIKGDLDKSKVVVATGATLATPIANIQIADRLVGIGINLLNVNQL